MKTKNGHMPAMPIVDGGFGQYAPEAHYGMSKREMMAMHAPECPDWFFDVWLEKNNQYEAICYSNGCFGTLKPEYENQLFFAWRTHYADALLKELEK